MTASQVASQAQALQTQQPGMHFFAVADLAQDEKLLDHFHKSGTKTLSKCLLADLGPDADQVSPHLIQIDAPNKAADQWSNAARYAEQLPPALTLIASAQPFSVLYKHLTHFTRVHLPDRSEMLLAYWDPAILGTLLGNERDATLHIPGPVLTPQQSQALLAPVSAWWYWDRTGILQRIDNTETPITVDYSEPTPLDQKQVDLLIEASVPDHVLAYVKETQPALLERLPSKQHYPTVRRLLVAAKSLRVDTQQDQVRFVSVSLLYGPQMKTDESIHRLLEKVQHRELKLDAALLQFPALKKGKS